MQYICVFNIYDPNYIKGVSLKIRKKEELLRAYQEVYTFCKTEDLNPDYTRWTMKHQNMLKISLQYRTVNSSTPPPDSHRTNPAERALQTYKSCVKSTMASLPPTFPIAYWCRLLSQIDFSVKIVRKCRQNPLLSAWASMEGEFHLNTTPITPPSSEMLLHKNPNRRY